MTEALKDYTVGANLVLNGMGKSPASESDMRSFWLAGLPADTAAEDFAYYRDQDEIAKRGMRVEADGRILYRLGDAP